MNQPYERDNNHLDNNHLDGIRISPIPRVSIGSLRITTRIYNGFTMFCWWNLWFLAWSNLSPANKHRTMSVNSDISQRNDIGQNLSTASAVMPHSTWHDIYYIQAMCLLDKETKTWKNRIHHSWCHANEHKLLEHAGVRPTKSDGSSHDLFALLSELSARNLRNHDIPWKTPMKKPIKTIKIQKNLLNTSLKCRQKPWNLPHDIPRSLPRTSTSRGSGRAPDPCASNWAAPWTPGEAAERNCCFGYVGMTYG